MMRILSLCTALLCAASAHAQSWAWDDGTVPFVVTPEEVVDRMLRLAEVGPGDQLIDLGSGDGRIVIEAAKRFGTRGLGVEIEPRLVELARDNAQRAGVESLARFEVRDLFQTDLRGASVVTMYLLPEINRKLAPRLLEQLKPGARIVSHDYDMEPWPYDEMLEIALVDKPVGPTGRSRVYLWVVPGDARGAWSAEIATHGGRWRFDIAQRYQILEVEARVPGGELLVREARLRGEEIRILVTGLVGRKAWNHLFRGKLAGDRIEGEVRISDGENNRTLPWNAIRAR
jgi:SAM-dependent methyltransferase